MPRENVARILVDVEHEGNDYHARVFGGAADGTQLEPEMAVRVFLEASDALKQTVEREYPAVMSKLRRGVVESADV